MTWWLFSALMGGGVLAWIVWIVALKYEEQLMDWTGEQGSKPWR